MSEYERERDITVRRLVGKFNVLFTVSDSKDRKKFSLSRSLNVNGPLWSKMKAKQFL